LEPRLTLIARAAYGARNAFAYIASALEGTGLLGGHARLVIVEEEPSPMVVELLQKGHRVAVLYGVPSPLFTDLAPEMARVSRLAPVVVGGPHAEGAYWQLLRLGAYAAVVGDGENAATGLVEHLLGWRPLEDVPNIAYQPEPGVFRVTRIELVDLDSYKPFSTAFKLYPPIEIMRGCFYSCRFCQVPWLFKSRVRYRSPDSVAEAARAYVAAGRRRIRFVAPIGFAYMSRRPGEPNVEAIARLLQAVREAGGTPFLGSFPSETRPEYVTPEVLETVRRLAGNRRISLGLQSGSNRVLRLMGRGHTVEEAFEAVELVLRYGFTPVVDIIFGLPGEEDEDVEATVKAMEKLASMGARLRLHSFLPLPGTPLARSRPRPLHPRYREAVRRLLGRGVLEGDWREQEQLAAQLYCITAYDPAPTRRPTPLPGAGEVCQGTWRLLDQLYAKAARAG
jgi:B12-binding domain/radical SAM domain protein